MSLTEAQRLVRRCTPVKPANAPHGVGHLAPALVLPQPPAPRAGAFSDHRFHGGRNG
jgi:hypothetical protein